MTTEHFQPESEGASMHSSDFRELFEELSAPFPEEQIKTRVQGGRKLAYITARMARHRLNEVLGYSNWSCEIEPGDKWVKCSLTIELPDGTFITRQALGGYPKMPLEEDAIKGGDSDAFKRACAMFGVASYLYGDDPEPPAEVAEPARRPTAPVNPTTPSKAYSKPTTPPAPSRSNYPAKASQGSFDPRKAGWPKSGSALFAWAKKVQEIYGYTHVIDDVNNVFVKGGSEYNFPNSWKEWDADMVECAAKFVAGECATLPTYDGQFDEKLGTESGQF